MSTSKATYHHGDLRAALVRAAMELLEESGETALSLRAVARRAGVSPAAPYRHYADREALVSAVAAVGYRELASGWRRRTHRPRPRSNSPASRSPTCSSRSNDPPCSESCSESRATGTTTSASPRLRRYRCMFAGSSSESFRTLTPEALATAIWALVHGLAFLHLDGKLDTPVHRR